MENNFNQQPQYQQPQYQQPQYQQPQYQQPQYQKPVRPQGAGLAGLVDFLVKLAPIAILVFLCIGAVGFLFYFIEGFINFIVNDLEYVGYIFNGLCSGIATVARYCFYSFVVAFAAKLLKK